MKWWDFELWVISTRLTLTKGSTSPTQGYCVPVEVDDRASVSEMVWKNLKPEAQQCNVSCAMILVTGTLVVQNFQVRMLLRQLEQLLHVDEAGEDQEEGEETRICFKFGLCFYL